MHVQQKEAIPGNNFSGSLRVVVAEQDKAVREALIDKVYDALGVYADSCNTARGVDRLLEKYPGEIVLAIVDTRLPDAPQGEVLELLTDAKIPTIAISPEVTDEVASRLVDKHIIDCVLKRGEDELDIVTDIVERTLLNHKRKILLYSHSDFNRRKIRQMLDIHRYTVYDVRSEREARRKLHNEPDIALVLLDQSVIEEKELTLISSLRQHYRKEELAIAAVCDQRDTQRNARLLRAGLNDVFCQPHQADEFYYRVRHCVESVERVREIKFSATRDRLTGLYNRDYLFDVGAISFGTAQRGDTPISLAMIEIDGFDELVLEHGHRSADAMLANIAPVIQRELRNNDIIARYHTATFACVASNVGDHNAIMVFERLRQRIAGSEILAGTQTLRVTASIGVCTQLYGSLGEMIGAAQQSLAEASKTGNKVVVPPG